MICSKRLQSYGAPNCLTGSLLVTLQNEGSRKIRVLCGRRLRRGVGHGVESEGSEREPVGALQKKVSVGLVEWFVLALKVGAIFYRAGPRKCRYVSLMKWLEIAIGRIAGPHVQ